MKQIIYIILAFILSVPSISAQGYTAQADSAYMSDDFQKAIELYEKAIAEDGSSSQIFFNLGNAYYRNGNFGKAILNYERALKLNPSNSDAKINLDFVNGKIYDKPVDNASLTEKLTDRVVSSMQADSWAWLTLACFTIMMALASGYIFCSGVAIRKTCFFGALVMLLATVSGVIISITAASRMTAGNKAIVISESVQLGTAPRVPKTKAEQAFLLHEGTKLTIVDSLTTTTDENPSKWYEVNVDKEHRAWINSADIEKI